MYLYGYHPCYAALTNPKRIVERVLVTDIKIWENLSINKKFRVEVIDRRSLENLLPPGVPHQGLALLVQPLETLDLSELAYLQGAQQRIVVLDHVSDPHNVGAILRSAAVFGASAVVMTERHAPKQSGVMAKAACGALERVPLCIVKNLAQALQQLKEFNFWCVGFAESGSKDFGEIDLGGKIALVLGSEGDGMRQRTQSICDFQVRLSVSDAFSTLNVSNAAAIALYETFKQQNNTLRA